jgi:hypothetical protein
MKIIMIHNWIQFIGLQRYLSVDILHKNYLRGLLEKQSYSRDYIPSKGLLADSYCDDRIDIGAADTILDNTELQYVNILNEF